MRLKVRQRHKDVPGQEWPDTDGEYAVSELASEWQGALSPFGPDNPLPLPPDAVNYEHPGPEELPNR